MRSELRPGPARVNTKPPPLAPRARAKACLAARLRRRSRLRRGNAVALLARRREAPSARRREHKGRKEHKEDLLGVLCDLCVLRADRLRAGLLKANPERI